MFDVFLSHNSKDKPSVLVLKRLLLGAGLSCWLDSEQLPPGGNWQNGLEAGIRNSTSVAVCFGPAGIGPWEEEEMQAALVLAVREKKRVIPVILPDAPKEPNVPLFLGNRTWVDLRAGFTNEDLDRLVWGITGTKPDQVLFPFDGNTLKTWVNDAELGTWSVVNSQIISFGIQKASPIFSDPDTPADLKSASILTWMGEVFHDGKLTASIFISGIGAGAAGFLLRHNRNSRTAVLAVLHKNPAENLLKLELWHREDSCLHLLKSVSCPPKLLQHGACQVDFEIKRNRTTSRVLPEGTTKGTSISTNMSLLSPQPPGYLGLINFGDWGVHYSKLKLHVIREASIE